MDINLLNVCRNVDNEIVTDDQGNWLVLNPTNNTIECVNPALLNAQSQPSVQPNSQEASSSSSANDKHQYQWERPAILSLIALYKDHYKDFKNTSIKNEKVWRIITETMNTFMQKLFEKKE
ncbi:hypothetical protein FQR65_LT19542 [Abscondita terminalis]|nr:hypothetical protein FQR65_LT19542 [Abscondita terminalis]